MFLLRLWIPRRPTLWLIAALALAGLATLGAGSVAVVLAGRGLAVLSATRDDCPSRVFAQPIRPQVGQRLDPVAILLVDGARIVQGGSTITRQLVKNVYVTPERSLSRKGREALLALALERRHGKDEILASYLNHAYWGRRGAIQLVGIEAGARGWFAKEAAPPRRRQQRPPDAARGVGDAHRIGHPSGPVGVDRSGADGRCPRRGTRRPANPVPGADQSVARPLAARGVNAAYPDGTCEFFGRDRPVERRQVPANAVVQPVRRPS